MVAFCLSFTPFAGRPVQAPPAAIQRPAAATELGWPNNILEQYSLGRLIGSGSYGIVRHGKELETGREVAVKVLTKSRKSQPRSRVLRKLAREVDLMARMQSCPNVVQLLTAFEDQDCLYIVTDLCRGGDLERVLQEHGPFSERATACVVYEALKMVASCHQQDIIHGDVKPANFLLRQHYADPFAAVESGRLQGAWLKTVDFGCSQAVRRERLTRRTGTPVFMAPEVFERDYGLEADLWSTGMMCYQLVSARFPFWESLEECREMSVTQVMASVIGGRVPLDYGPWLRFSADGLDLVRALLARPPQIRITAEEALEHRWFKRQLQWLEPEHADQGQRSNIIPKTAKPKGRKAKGKRQGLVPERIAADSLSAGLLCL